MDFLYDQKLQGGKTYLRIDEERVELVSLFNFLYKTPMVPQKNRLGSLFFKNLFKKGVIIDSQSFSLKYVKGQGGEFKISVVISKKVSLKATERNLLKRRFLSVLMEQKDLLKQGFSYILYPKKGSDLVSRERLFQEINEKILVIYEQNH